MLTQKINGKPLTTKEYFSDKYAIYGGAYGQALAKLHLTLNKISPTIAIDSYKVEQISKEWALPKTIKHLQQWDSQLSETFLFLFEKELEHFQSLPQQIIHRDPNPGNVLFDGIVVTGFIDFDISVSSYRLFDLCYTATACLSTSSQKNDYQIWPKLFAKIVSGYELISPLTAEEKQAILAMLCSIQLIATAYFSQREEWREFVTINRQNLIFIINHYYPNEK